MIELNGSRFSFCKHMVPDPFVAVKIYGREAQRNYTFTGR